MSFTLKSWREATAQRVVLEVPNQSFETAIALAEAYLSEVGGWNPIDPTQPVGEGLPVTGETPEQAAESIRNLQANQVYVLNFTAHLNIRGFFMANLAPGQDATSALNAIEDEVRDYIQNSLGPRLGYLEVNHISAEIASNGNTTGEERRAIRTSYNEGDTTDPRVIALREARQANNLDETWNVSFCFVDPTQERPISIIISKYESTSFETLDSGATTQYVYKLNPRTYRVQTGVQLPV